MVRQAQIIPVSRMSPQAGIAIGPILFIVAILAVLVGALAAGDSGFSTSITQESSRVNATTIVEQGNNLQSAMDRVLANGADPTTIYVVADVTAAGLTAQEQESALFAPTGGGLTYPTPPSTAIPTGAQWYFIPAASLDGVGTQTSEYVAVLPVISSAMCLAINSVIFGQNSAQATLATIPTISTAPSLAAPTGGSDSASVAPSANSFTTVGATGASISGAPQACVTEGSSFYYYQLLIAN